MAAAPAETEAAPAPPKKVPATGELGDLPADATLDDAGALSSQCCIPGVFLTPSPPMAPTELHCMGYKVCSVAPPKAFVCTRVLTPCRLAATLALARRSS